MNPSIACICQTFGRPHLLPEAVESFHRQDYEGEKILVIVNNDPEVTYIYDHPEVKILNLEKRSPNDGYGRNIGVRSALHCDAFFDFDDDDILLPWCLSTAVEICTNKKMMQPLGRYVWRNGRISHYAKRLTGCTLVYKDFYLETGGWSDEEVYRSDGEFRKRVKELINDLAQPVTRDQAYYIYRQHSLPRVSRTNKNQNQWDKVYKVIRSYIPPGVYKLFPQWYVDYVALIGEFNESDNLGEEVF